MEMECGDDDDDDVGGAADDDGRGLGRHVEAAAASMEATNKSTFGERSRGDDDIGLG
jgi:hypothetical protein